MLNLRRILLLLILCSAPARFALAEDDAETFFENSVRPVLLQHCSKCHGGEKTSGGLRVDSREALLKGGDSGPALIPGDVDESLLVQAIRRSEALQMPPDEALPAPAVAALEKWISSGAVWPKQVNGQAGDWKSARHWAFEPVRPVAVPQDPTGWSRTPVDQFIQAARTQQGLAPQPEADRATLLRRLSFDLIGLPPTPEEFQRFLSDDSPDAYEQLVERLLASPRYGERWGRHWMDVVRYADTAGDNADYPVPEARHYRDYLIQAFNDDLPYDEFLSEQLAGDVLVSREPDRPERYAQRIAATGFLALSRRYGTAPFELWHLTLEDTIDTTGRAFLGLSLRCARCHDHKFDPVTAQDYYALYGIFNSTRFPWAGGEEVASKKLNRQNFVPLVPAREAEPKLAAWRAEQARLEAQIKALETDDPDALRLAELKARIKTETEAATSSGKPAETSAELAALERERAETERRLKDRQKRAQDQLRALRKAGVPADLLTAYAVTEATPADVPLHKRGEPTDPGPLIPRGVPAFLSGGKPLAIESGSSGRLELARWLTDPEHPLTARVMVNRVWQYHFGRGLVATPSNFGLRGAAPSHPELLDWLTGQFVTTGWSIKNLHRQIVHSSTYRLASGHDEQNALRDPANRWYWRFDRRRLEAEALRDAMLAACGTLDLGSPPEHPFPPFQKWGWTQHSPFKAVYASSHRSLYLMTQRLVRHPYLALFDGPDPNTSTDLRTSATVPLQALYLLNNEFMSEQAQAFAQRLLHGAAEPTARVALAYQLAYGRLPRADETERGGAFISRYVDQLAADGMTEVDAQRQAWTSFARVLFSSHEFCYLD